MILTEQGIVFREYYYQQEIFFASQDIQKFDFIFDSAFTVSVYLKEQSLLDVPQCFECGFYLLSYSCKTNGGYIATNV